MISEGARIVLSVLDEAKAEMERDHPGWRIWFVPRTNGPTRWCAHRLPLLAESSPDDLRSAMSDVDEGRADNGAASTFPLAFEVEGSEAGA
jgi:hypothetical protein